MRINHNIDSTNTYRQLNINSNLEGKYLGKLNNGQLTNIAGDDVIQLSINEKTRAQIKTDNLSNKEAEDAVSMINVADDALTEVQSRLQIMKELSAKAEDSSLTASDRDAAQKEISRLVSEISNISSSTSYRGKNILDGSMSGNNMITFQTGTHKGQSMAFSINNMSTSALGISNSAADGKDSASTDENVIDVTTPENAGRAVQAIETAIYIVSAERSKLDNVSNRIVDMVTGNDRQVALNSTAADSRIRDNSMANEMMEATKQNILSQASQAMAAQANFKPQDVLTLLR